MDVYGQKTRLNMDEIQHIIINRYSISFLPKSPSLKMIAVDVAYRDFVAGTINDWTLIVDNFSKYN